MGDGRRDFREDRVQASPLRFRINRGFDLPDPRSEPVDLDLILTVALHDLQVFQRLLQLTDEAVCLRDRLPPRRYRRGPIYQPRPPRTDLTKPALKLSDLGR